MNKQSYSFGVEPSEIRKLFEYGKKRKLEIGEDNVFDFSLGNPSVEPPKELKQELFDLIDRSSSLELHGYTSNAGDMEARKAITDNLSKRFNFEVLPELTLMTCGAAAGLAISLNAIFEKDDEEIIVFAPHFPDYKVFIEGAHGKMVLVNPESNLKPSLKDLQSKINKETKAVIINSPCNPSGVVLDELTLKGICSLLQEKEKEYGHPIYIISDEPYREIVFDMTCPFVFNYYDNSLICYSFSKSLSIPGERIGYITVNKNCKDAKYLFKAVCGSAWKLGYICAPSLMQHLIPHLLDVQVDVAAYKKNRDYLYQELTNIGYEVVKPSGTFYMFVKALESDAKAFSEAAKKYELLLVPSDTFSIKGYIRIAYCVDYKVIENSIPAFKKLFDEYRR